MACPAPIGVVASGVRTATWSHLGMADLGSDDNLVGKIMGKWLEIWRWAHNDENSPFNRKSDENLWNVGASQLQGCMFYSSCMWGCVFLSYPILPPKLFWRKLPAGTCRSMLHVHGKTDVEFFKETSPMRQPVYFKDRSCGFPFEQSPWGFGSLLSQCKLHFNLS